MISRELYLRRLRQLKDLHVVKVVSGVRRTGKSTLLLQFRNELIKSPEIQESQVLYYNLEDKLLEKYTTDANLLHDEILKKTLKSDKKFYVFIDEVQLIPEFEKTVDSLFIRDNIDLYITGSNAYMTSSAISTMLTGRYIEIEVTPLSLAEFAEFFPSQDTATIFNNYLLYGGFPEVANFLVAGSESEVSAYLSSIYWTILEKDIKLGGAVKSLSDFENLTKFCMNNIGSIVSPNRIATTMTANQQTIDTKTVERYLEILTSCFVLYRTERFDVRGKKLLQTLQKYYCVDNGLVNTLVGTSVSADLGHKLENIVYLELKRRYKDVWIGKNYEKEIDFVVRTEDGNLEYYQVSQSLISPETRERELKAFPSMNDEYKKTVLSLDMLDTIEDNGIRHKNLIKWLMEKK